MEKKHLTIKKIDTVGLHLQKIPEQAKVFHGDKKTEQWWPGGRAGGWGGGDWLLRSTGASQGGGCVPEAD